MYVCVCMYVFPFCVNFFRFSLSTCGEGVTINLINYLELILGQMDLLRPLRGHEDKDDGMNDAWTAC